jgi:hypothetical protein
MFRRVLFIALTGIATLVLFIISARLVREHQEQMRLETGLARVKSGMTRADVDRLLGRPTFDETPITETFAPQAVACRGAVRAYIYQAARERTLVVAFSSKDQVLCVEAMTAFRIIRV